MSASSTSARRLVRLAEISERTQVPVETLRWLRKMGRGPQMFVLAGRVVAYECDVDAWVENAAQQARHAS